MADAEHSKCFARKGVWVRLPPSAPKINPQESWGLFLYLSYAGAAPLMASPTR